MPRSANQALADAHEWSSVADQARRLSELQQAMSDRITSAHVRAIERMAAEGTHGAVDELGQALVDVIELVARMGEPIGELVSSASARITTLRIEVADLRDELGLGD